MHDRMNTVRLSIKRSIPGLSQCADFSGRKSSCALIPINVDNLFLLLQFVYSTKYDIEHKYEKKVNLPTGVPFVHS